MVGKSIRTAIEYKGRNLVTTVAETHGNIDHRTVTAVVNANGDAYKPIIVYPGVQAHYRKFQQNNVIITQTLPMIIPDCYFYQRPIAGVDTEIFSLGKTFLSRDRKHKKEQLKDSVGTRWLRFPHPAKRFAVV